MAWIGFQMFMLLTMGDDMVSWAAHVGGFVAGSILVIFMKRRDVPVLDRALETPKAVVRSVPDIRSPTIAANADDLNSTKTNHARTRQWGRSP